MSQRKPFEGTIKPPIEVDILPRLPCRRHRTTDCLTEATGVCVHDLIAAYPDGMNQHHVALHFGVDHTRIQQIEMVALRKLARIVACRGLDLARVVSGRFGAPVRRYGAAL